MMKAKLFLLLSFFLMLVLFPAKVYSCGCGLALTDEKVFNALKETQAYLLIDVKDKSNYYEMPFFRMVSMDKPHDVTIVFPIKQIPSNVEGKKITAGEFLDQYGFNKIENAAQEQDPKTVIKKVNEGLFPLANGLIPLPLSLILSGGYLGLAGSNFTFAPTVPTAHFEFEGGKLDVYNASSIKTLNEFARQINTTLTDKVKELVNKYKNYYVAVLTLNVSSVIDENQIKYLETCMPQGLERIKDQLSQDKELSYDDLDQITQKELAQSSCGIEGKEILKNYLAATTYASNDVKGNLIIMKFNGNNEFFYPTSLVSSYKYPIKDERYYIKVPEDLHIKLSTSNISKTINMDKERWYKFSSKNKDLQGTIIDADSIVKLFDKVRSSTAFIYNNIMFLILPLYVLLFILPLIIFRKIEKLSLRNLLIAVVSYLLGGLVLSGIVMVLFKKKKIAISYFGIWIILLLILIIFK